MKTQLNLLSPGFCRSQIVLARLRQWIIVWLLAAGVGGVVIWISWQSNRDDAEKVALLEREYEPVKQKKSEIQSLKQDLAQLQVREQLTLELARQRPALTLLGYVSQAARDSGGNVSVREFTLDRRRGAADQTENVLSLSGVGTDNLAVAQFVASLRDAGIFQQVQLKSTGVASIGRKACWAYELECSF